MGGSRRSRTRTVPAGGAGCGWDAGSACTRPAATPRDSSASRNAWACCSDDGEVEGEGVDAAGASSTLIVHPHVLADFMDYNDFLDQANRELSTRFDFKGVDAKFELDDATIKQSAPSDFQLKQMEDILRGRLIARGIDARCLEFGEVETNLAGARQSITVKQGIERELAKKIQGAIKDAKLKVDTQINGDKLRVNGKKRDDLQSAIALLKAGEFERPLQFDNFRD